MQNVAAEGEEETYVAILSSSSSYLIPGLELVDHIEHKLSRVDTLNATDPRCYSGTRKAILEDLRRCLLNYRDRTAPSIYWITGVPGCGKSTISRSLLDMAKKHTEEQPEKIVCSWFFFSRDHDDRKSCKKLMATVARDLVSYDDTDANAVQCVYDAVEKKLDSSSFVDQVHHFLRQPLESASRPVLLVWDALDECVDNSDRRLLCNLITQLPQFPPHLSILITSRPETDFENARNRLSTLMNIHHRNLTFRLSGDSSTLHDIDIYIRQRFHEIRESQQALEDWPGEEAFKQLNAKVDGLFVIASFFCNFVDNYRYEDRLKYLLEAPDIRDGSDYSYFHTGLRHLFKSDTTAEANRRQGIIGAILAAQHPLQTNVLAKFGGVDYKVVEAIIKQLNPFLIEGETGTGTWRFMHKSVSDFFQSPHAKEFRIELVEASAALAVPCLEILCGEIEDAFAQCDRTARPSVPDIDKVDAGLPNLSKGLRYACRFWAYHLKDVGLWNQKVEELLDDFFTRRLLQWLHVMGRFGWLNDAISCLESVEDWKVWNYHICMMWNIISHTDSLVANLNSLSWRTMAFVSSKPSAIR